MDEIEETIAKIKDKGCGPMLLTMPDIKDKARKLMHIFPETSPMELSSVQEVFKRLEADFKKEVVSDMI